MVAREHKGAAMHKKLQLLRSITKSHARSRTSIILDASKYIEEMKRKVETVDQDIAATRTSDDPNPLPVVSVEAAQEKSFVIDVVCERTCPGLLVFILEAFEELGLEVLQARVSCSDTFHLDALAHIENQGIAEHMDNQVVKQAVFQAIQNWSEISKQE